MCCEPVFAAGDPLPESDRTRSTHLDLLPTTRSARIARAYVAEHLQDDPAWLRDAALLVTSELVTNAALHARTPLQLGLTPGDTLILIAVGDHNRLRPEQQPYSAFDAGGRGLLIVDRFSETWGTTPSEFGKTVWCALRRTSLEETRSG